MDNPYRHSTMLGGTLICFGAVLLLMSGYFLFDAIPDKAEELGSLRWQLGTGYFLWVLGSVLVARARFSSLWAGFFCGLLLLPGLIALTCFISTRTRQEIWQEANPDFTKRAQRRQYRNLKSLY